LSEQTAVIQPTIKRVGLNLRDRLRVKGSVVSVDRFLMRQNTLHPRMETYPVF
jgi:hypothetical protein